MCLKGSYNDSFLFLAVMMEIFAVTITLLAIFTIIRPQKKTLRIVLAIFAFASIVASMLTCYFIYSLASYSVYFLVAGIMFSVSTGFSLACLLISIFRKSENKVKLGWIIPSAILAALFPVISIFSSPTIDGRGFANFSGQRYSESYNANNDNDYWNQTPNETPNTDTSYSLNSAYTWHSNNDNVNHNIYNGELVPDLYLEIVCSDAIIKVQMYTNPESLDSPYGVDIGCYMELHLTRGDEFYLSYNHKMYSWDSIGHNTTVSEAFQYNPNSGTIRCTKTAVYSLYLNSGESIWLEYY